MQVTDQDLLVNTIIDTGSIFRMDAGDRSGPVGEERVIDTGTSPGWMRVTDQGMLVKTIIDSGSISSERPRLRSSVSSSSLGSSRWSPSLRSVVSW